jgi:tRNA (guanosine-2'-O-)-methyltransferase
MRRHVSWALVAGLVAAGCGAARGETESDTARAARVTETRILPVTGTLLEPGPLATPIEVACDEAARELCNAIDDDCNGVIDDGCGYEGGSIQVTLAWNSGADVDLYVTDPDGETLSYQRGRVPSGGVVDQAGRGNCAPEAPHPRIESAHWGARALPGRYAIYVHYWGECVSNAGPATVFVSVAVGGRTLGAFDVSLAPNDREPVVEFDVAQVIGTGDD